MNHDPESTNSTRGRWFARIMVGLLAVYWLLLFTGTHIPLPHMPGGSGNDKIAHFVGYFLLSLLLCAFMAARGPLAWTHFAGVAMVLAGYGIIDELLQIPVPGRSADLYDWYADCLGVAAGVAMFGVGYAWYWEKK